MAGSGVSWSQSVYDEAVFARCVQLPRSREIPSRRNLLPIVTAGEWVKSTHRTRTIGMCSFDVRTKFNSPPPYGIRFLSVLVK